MPPDETSKIGTMPTSAVPPTNVAELIVQAIIRMEGGAQVAGTTNGRGSESKTCGSSNGEQQMGVARASTGKCTEAGDHTESTRCGGDGERAGGNSYGSKGESDL